MKQSRDYEKAMRRATRSNLAWTDYLILTDLYGGDDATAYRVPIIDGPLDEEWYEVIWPDGQRMRLHPYGFDADRDRWPPWGWTEVDEHDRPVGTLWSTRLTPAPTWGMPDRVGNPLEVMLHSPRDLRWVKKTFLPNLSRFAYNVVLVGGEAQPRKIIVHTTDEEHPEQTYLLEGGSKYVLSSGGTKPNPDTSHDLARKVTIK